MEAKATKVIKTQAYKDSQKSEAIVAEGKLVLIYNDKHLPEIGMIGSNNVHPLFMWTQAHKDGFKKLIEYHSTKMVQPIIISETEKIEDEDKVLHNGKILTVSKNRGLYLSTYENTHIDIRTDLCQKILVMPELFSPKQLQAIVDGKIKNGDKILIECEFGSLEPDLSKPPKHGNYIKLNQQNQIILLPAKEEKMYPKSFIDALHGMEGDYTERMFSRWKEHGKL